MYYVSPNRGPRMPHNVAVDTAIMLNVMEIPENSTNIMPDTELSICEPRRENEKPAISAAWVPMREKLF